MKSFRSYCLLPFCSQRSSLFGIFSNMRFQNRSPTSCFMAPCPSEILLILRLVSPVVPYGSCHIAFRGESSALPFPHPQMRDIYRGRAPSTYVMQERCDQQSGQSLFSHIYKRGGLSLSPPYTLRFQLEPTLASPSKAIFKKTPIKPFVMGCKRLFCMHRCLSSSGYLHDCQGPCPCSNLNRKMT